MAHLQICSPGSYHNLQKQAISVISWFSLQSPFGSHHFTVISLLEGGPEAMLLLADELECVA